MRQLHPQILTLTKLLSTEGRFGRRQLFHNFIGCGAFYMDFFTDAARTTGICPSMVVVRAIEG